MSTPPTSFLFHYTSAVDVLHSLQSRHSGPSLLPFQMKRDWQRSKHTYLPAYTHKRYSKHNVLTNTQPGSVSLTAGAKKEGVKELQNKTISSSLSQRKTEIRQYCLVQEFSGIEVKTLKQSASSAKDQSYFSPTQAKLSCCLNVRVRGDFTCELGMHRANFFFP